MAVLLVTQPQAAAGSVGQFQDAQIMQAVAGLGDNCPPFPERFVQGGVAMTADDQVDPLYLPGQFAVFLNPGVGYADNHLRPRALRAATASWPPGVGRRSPPVHP